MKNSILQPSFFILAIILFLFSFLLPAFSFADERETEMVTFNFVDVELPTIAKFISEVTGKNLIFDERLRGKITIIAPTRLHIDAAFSLFISVLEFRGFTVVPTGVDAYKIIPLAGARHKGLPVVTEKEIVGEGFIVRLIPVEHISADEAFRFFQPLISRAGHISIFRPDNLLLVIDSGLNIEKILTILGRIDQPVTLEVPEVIFLRHSCAQAIAKSVNESLAQKAKRLPGVPGIADTRVTADERLNAVIVSGDEWIRESVRSFIALLDLPSPMEQRGIHVHPLKNADATELVGVLNEIIKGTQSPHRTSSGRGGSPSSPPGTEGIFITADEATNSLLIVASPADYENLRQIIGELDRKRRQVFVEAMITEIRIQELLELGIKWRAAVVKDGEPVFVGGFGMMDPTTIMNIITGMTALTLGGFGNFFTVPEHLLPGGRAPGLSALFALDEFRGAVDVLSAPQLLTSDNKEAEIMVGVNVPFIIGRERVGVDDAILVAVERHDVGVKLNITPRITEGDYLELDIYQEISSVKPAPPDILVAVGPTIVKRATRTSVVVKDGQTIVIGGLMAEEEVRDRRVVPILGHIPILGLLFRYEMTRKEQTNLLIFITPRIVRDAEDIARISREKEKEHAVDKGEYAEGELLVKFEEEATKERALSIITQEGASVIEFIEGINVYHIRLRQGQSVKDALDEFSVVPEVFYAEPNYIIRIR